MCAELSTSDLDKSFAIGCGQRIKTARTNAQRSQEEVADALGYSMSSVSAWERGAREPGLRALASLARYLETDVGAFFPSVVDGWEAPVETPAQRLTRVERQVKTLRTDLYAAIDELRTEGLLAQSS